METQLENLSINAFTSYFLGGFQDFQHRDTLNQNENFSLLLSYWLVYLFNHLGLHPMLILYTLCVVLEYVPYIHG